MLSFKPPPPRLSQKKRSVGRRRRRRCARTRKQKGRTGFRGRHRMKLNRVTLVNRRMGTRVRRGGVIQPPSLTNVLSYNNVENELNTTNQSQITILNTIGKGAHGLIFEVQYNAHLVCALKYMLKKEESATLYSTEVFCLEQLGDSERFPKLITHGETRNAYFLCISLYKKDLFTYFNETHNSLMLTDHLTAMKNLKSYAHQILHAIQYMHSKSILHLDLKLENIMLTNEDSDVVIIDFGMAKILTDKETQIDCKPTTLRITAPEVFKNKVCGRPADLWSFGIILFILYEGKYPFNEQKEITSHKTDSLKFEKVTDKNTISLIQQLLTQDENKRLTVDQALAHTFFKEDGTSKNEEEPAESKRRRVSIIKSEEKDTHKAIEIERIEKEDGTGN